MKYRRDKYNNELSALGFGCMRFPQKGGKIDIAATEKLIVDAYNAGINYFDTAYIYSGSEAALGEILEKNRLREKIMIATKLPQYLITSRTGLDRYFNEQLKRLRTNYIDYYLMHHLTDIAMWDKLKKIGIIDWIKEKTESGVIRNIGFSYHGNTDGFLKILKDYSWDFCQIQYNYFDEVSQAGVVGLKAAAKEGIPVIIMEPLRGGKLADKLPEKAKNIIKNSSRHWSGAEWGFRWLYNQPEVTVVLSGMSTPEMLYENCKIASEADVGQFTNEDYATISEISKTIREREKIGCTGCRYCMPCPKGVDIPGTFLCYNAMFIDSKKQGRFQYAQTVGLTKEPAFASQCIGCGKCEKHCPQSIPIREKLKDADKALRPLPYKIGINVARKFMFRKSK